jgi:hypothetical protein
MLRTNCRSLPKIGTSYGPSRASKGNVRMIPKRRRAS